jgi:transcriptional regulator with XRE-family HTH domain
MKRRSFTYLRAHRKRWSLSERELAGLLGTSASSACRMEKSGRPPSVKFALACQVIFGEEPRKMFPALYERVEEAVMVRAAGVYKLLDGKSDRRSVRHRELLDEMMKRAANAPGV